MADDEPEDADAEEEQTADADEQGVEEPAAESEEIEDETSEGPEAESGESEEPEPTDDEAEDESEDESEAEPEEDDAEDAEAEADADEDEEPEEDHPIQLGVGEDIEGVPLAQVSARLMWGIERSQIRRREGDTVIRTPDGPRELGDVLDEIDLTYFEKRQEFEEAVRDVIGTGPIPTAGE